MLFTVSLYLSCVHKMSDEALAKKYNDMAVAEWITFTQNPQIDTATVFKGCKTEKDSIFAVANPVVERIQSLLDSAIIYNPNECLYYNQKARFYKLVSQEDSVRYYNEKADSIRKKKSY